VRRHRSAHLRLPPRPRCRSSSLAASFLCDTHRHSPHHRGLLNARNDVPSSASALLRCMSLSSLMRPHKHPASLTLGHIPSPPHSTLSAATPRSLPLTPGPVRPVGPQSTATELTHPPPQSHPQDPVVHGGPLLSKTKAPSPEGRSVSRASAAGKVRNVTSYSSKMTLEI
jgi:hypothetical protein